MNPIFSLQQSGYFASNDKRRLLLLCLYWHCNSFPKEVNNTSVEVLLAILQNNFHQMEAYDNEKWQYFLTNRYDDKAILINE